MVLCEAARKRVRAEVSASESLRKERRLARNAARRRFGIRPGMYRLLFLGMLLMCGYFEASHGEYIVALIILWTLSTRLFLAESISCGAL